MGALDALLRYGEFADEVGALSGKAAGAGRIIGYHGTPHSFPSEAGAPFGRFRLESMGSGEGNQGYGPGHYIAEKSDVGALYRDALANIDRRFDGAPLRALGSRFATDYEGHDRDVLRALLGVNGDAERIIDAHGPDLKKWPRSYADTLDNWVRSGRLGPHNNGRLLEVDVPKGPYLDWDAPLSQSPPEAQAVLRHILGEPRVRASAGPDTLLTARGGAVHEFPEGWSGDPEEALLATPGQSVFHAAVRAEGRNPLAVMEPLRDNGVKGTGYLDAHSRLRRPGKPHSRNYVIFNGDDINIRAMRALLMGAIGGGGAYGALAGGQQNGNV